MFNGVYAKGTGCFLVVVFLEANLELGFYATRRRERIDVS